MLQKRIFFSKKTKNIKYPDFLILQIKSFKDFLNLKNINKKKEKLYILFKNFFPIINRKKNLKIYFLKYYLKYPKYNVSECIEKNLTYKININIKLKIVLKVKNKEKKYYKKFYLCSCPYMTNNASFIFNGVERVIIHQIIKSNGIFFGFFLDYHSNKIYFSRIIPEKGCWIEIFHNKNKIFFLSVDKKHKFSIITFLRALGYKSINKILEIFNFLKKIKIKKKYIGYKISNFYNKKFNFLNNKILNKELYNLLKKKKIYFLYVYKKKIDLNFFNIILKNIKLDNNKNYRESLFYVYKVFNKIYPVNLKVAKKFIKNKFFNKKNYNLGLIGRFKINSKLKIKIKNSYLTKLDYKYIIKFLYKLLYNFNSKYILDDVDNLSNRQILTVGNQLNNLFSIGLLRIIKIIKYKINLKENFKFNIKNLINSKILNSILNTFFGTSQFSQFLDRTNNISELTHKRRLTLLGPGGLMKSRAGFEARDINFSHYGKLCPIETPEGPNIGLIYSLCLFANVDKLGFLISPYRKILNGKLINKIVYLNSAQEFNLKIGSFFINKKKKKQIVRYKNKNFLKKINEINYIDYSSNYIISLTTSLIPFLENNDANRALMGSNMMRQALPLLKLESPIVGTSVEKSIIYYSRNYINAKEKGKILYVDSSKIIVKYYYNEKKINTDFKNLIYTHKVPKFQRTNQNTCFNLKPLVKKGEKIKKNQILCEGFCNDKGELALGKNLLVAFMFWKGFNFEDSIVISNKILREDVFTSINIESFELSIKKNKFGKEEFTRNLPSITKKNKKKLDKNGIIKIGSIVKPGDILIGKIIPKIKENITPEEKFLQYIFGDKASNIQEVSLKAPAYLRGVVIDVKLYNFEKKIKNKKEKILNLKKKYKKKKKKIFEILIYKQLKLLKNIKLKKNIKVKIIKDKKKIKILYKKGSYLNSIILIYLFKKNKIFNCLNIKKKTKKYLKILLNNFNIYYEKIKNKYEKKIEKILYGENLLNKIKKKVKIYVAQKRKLKVGDKMSGRHGNKGVIAKILREEDMPFLSDGTVIDIVLNPLSIPSRMNLGQILESILGYIGYKRGEKYSIPVFDSLNIRDLNKICLKNKIKNLNKKNLYDGLTGEKFSQKVTIGVIYMLKLSHMVDDKIHSRSTGPYSLITQQPLGGKSKLGGQRFGEMEVWALEAYGASNILRELLTIKSDDIYGRTKTYENIIKDKNLPSPNIPESFKVLENELKGLCINLKYNENKKNKY
ncbi:MAG: DNA-directed RNA polymerase subunit beta [Candidatus Shikimatogenerans sp. JK-2022]|nr:DNA-directed RNA polymerase subunit beta [Candidatus Shikimatogenerans bostrichidophilus]